MNTPSNKRYSSASEYGTPGAVDDDSTDNSLYFSFSDNQPNKENSINGGHWSTTDLTPSSSHVTKAKTPLLRKVLQSNFTPRNANNKRVSFSHLPKPEQEKNDKIAKTAQSVTNSFDLEPIRESLVATVATEQEKIDEDGADQDANDLIDDDEAHNNTIIENPVSVKHSSGVLAKSSEQLESNAPHLKNTSVKNSKSDIKPEITVLSKVPTRNVTKMDRKRLVEENRKSILPVAKKPTRATTYKRRSSTYEPSKLKISKFVSGAHTNTKAIVKTIAPTKSIASNYVRMSMAQSSKLTVASTRQSIALKKQPPQKPTSMKTQASSSSSRPSVASVASVMKVAGAVAASIPNVKPSSSSLVPTKSEFQKPNGIVLRTKSNGLKCQYCDKCFVKSHGMETHLLEKCEKIPANVRRQLLKKADSSKSFESSKTMRHDSDSISKYSRFFVNISNDAGLQGDEVEKGLKNLRIELRKVKSHTGITRTPSKSLRCHICKKHFLDCVDYAEHMSNHNNNQ